jgi:hypothetical protein
MPQYFVKRKLFVPCNQSNTVTLRCHATTFRGLEKIPTDRVEKELASALVARGNELISQISTKLVEAKTDGDHAFIYAELKVLDCINNSLQNLESFQYHTGNFRRLESGSMIAINHEPQLKELKDGQAVINLISRGTELLSQISTKMNAAKTQGDHASVYADLDDLSNLNLQLEYYENKKWE